MKTIHILALGKSLRNYIPDGNITIGVNDIFRYHQTDYLLTLDRPEKFSFERHEIINTSTPSMGFLSHLNDWSHMPSFKRIMLAPKRSDISYLDNKDVVCFSNNSVFTAAVYAYRLGAMEIILHGADFTNHPHLSTQSNLKTTLNDFHALKEELEKRSVNLYVSSKESLLSGIMKIKG